MLHALSIVGLVAVALVGGMFMSSISAPMEPVLSSKPAVGRVTWWDRIIYAFTLLSILGLALTGLGTFAVSSKPMTGWVLMAHATFGPPFAICIAVLAISWVDRCRFGQNVPGPFGAGQKFFFWLILLASLIVILSAVIPMLPLCGTHGQELLYKTHQYSSLLLAVFVVAHVACSVVRK
ncbi:MAG: cytochrome b/b6 domain-containing protein [Bacillota bacterium]